MWDGCPHIHERPAIYTVECINARSKTRVAVMGGFSSSQCAGNQKTARMVWPFAISSVTLATPSNTIPARPPGLRFCTLASPVLDTFTRAGGKSLRPRCFYADVVAGYYYFNVQGLTNWFCVSWWRNLSGLKCLSYALCSPKKQIRGPSSQYGAKRVTLN